MTATLPGSPFRNRSATRAIIAMRSPAYARVEGVAQPVADKVECQRPQEDHQARERGRPPEAGGDTGLSFRDQHAPLGDARPGEADEGERGGAENDMAPVTRRRHPDGGADVGEHDPATEDGHG